VLFLDSQLRLIALEELFRGSLAQTSVHPREIVMRALELGAVDVVLAHNHPSGDPQPSSADVTITRQLRSASEIVDLRLHDHVVLGDPALDPIGLGYYSFRRGGLL